MNLAIITPRYGAEILGGAETFARHLAEKLAERDHQVHVYTTCAKDYYSWANVLPEGSALCNRVTVHRFPITSYHQTHFHTLSQKLLRQWELGKNEQKAWLAAGAHSQALYHAPWLRKQQTTTNCWFCPIKPLWRRRLPGSPQNEPYSFHVYIMNRTLIWNWLA